MIKESNLDFTRICTLLFFSLIFMSCAKEKPEIVIEDFKPANVDFTIDSQLGSGEVTVKPTADRANGFRVNFNDEKSETISFGQSATYTFTKTGKYEVKIMVTAFGNGGNETIVSKTLAMEVSAAIDPVILKNLAGEGSKSWKWHKTEPGHFGVGPIDANAPTFFSAKAEQLNGCLYDDVMTFSYDSDFNYTYELEPTDNQIFVNWREVSRYFEGEKGTQNEDQCRDLSDKIKLKTTWQYVEANGEKTLTLDNSTLSYQANITTYKILKLTETELVVRGIQEIDGDQNLAWYHTFIPASLEIVIPDPPTFDQLLWSDEFNVDGAPNPDNWNYDIGTGSNGWGNNESQYYTNRAENVVVSNGHLVITAKKESFEGSQYTSARILTQDKFSFKYGRVDARAKLPTGTGTWPAIWSLGNSFKTIGWPNCGEIDIMEHVGKQQDKIFGTTHDAQNFGAGSRGTETTVPGASNNFHTYSMIWNQERIWFLVDDQVYGSVSNNSGRPFNSEFFLIMNVAMGGSFGGPIQSDFVESRMEVDFIRVYQ